jgi:hypothetical protein
LEDTASAHITEDGYVKHRIAELVKRRLFSPSNTVSASPALLAKSA